jgi:hypothetical protein
MSKIQLLNQLFNAHSKDLNDVRPEYENCIVCPICLRIFEREAITDKTITDGHVWPKRIRSTSRSASDLRVLLCKSCNNLAGSRGDKQMQLLERLQEEKETGKLLGLRKVQIFTNGYEKPIELRVNVDRDSKDASLTLTGRLDNNLNFINISPEDRERFEKIRKGHDKVRIVVHNHHEYHPEMVSVGWITSGYLMAFYRLGYRYILHSSLNPIRKYILQSFDEYNIESLSIPNQDDFAVREYLVERYPEPALSLIYPLQDGKKVFLQVNYNKYEIRLPFRFNPFVFNSTAKQAIPNPENLFDPDNFLYFRIDCTKTIEHICWYDYLLGKPYPI